MTRRQFLRAGGAATIAALDGPASSAFAQGSVGVTLRFGRTPSPVRGTDNRTCLVYELHVVASREVELTRLAVLDGRTALLTYGPEDLEDRTMRPAEPRSGRYGRLVQPRTPSVVSIWLVVPDGRPIRRLQHELQTTGTPTAVSEAALSPEWSEPLVLGPPFRQGLWLAHNGPGAHRAAHWGSMLVSGRRITVPQRYAIDFMGLDENGRGARRAMEGSANADWSGFGRDVIAVANGVVRESRDGVVDNPPLYEPPPPRDAELANVGGNYVVLDIGGGRLVHYVHLQRDSVSVRAGQRVRRGDLLGRLGNSGNSNGAHLHFNVVDSARQSQAEGLPYAFATFVSRGSTTADAAFSELPPAPLAPRLVERALPLNGSVLEFANP